jgi:glutathione synthase
MEGSFKGNLAAGGLGVARELSDDQMKASTEIGKLLLAEGIIFAGIDMIGNSLTEINITSPTGAREILSQTGRSPIQALLQSI